MEVAEGTISVELVNGEDGNAYVYIYPNGKCFTRQDGFCIAVAGDAVTALEAAMMYLKEASANIEAIRDLMLRGV
jgi:hypothetical protein